MGYYNNLQIQEQQDSRDQCDWCQTEVTDCTCVHRCGDCYSGMKPFDYEKNDSIIQWTCTECGNFKFQPVSFQ